MSLGTDITIILSIISKTFFGKFMRFFFSGLSLGRDDDLDPLLIYFF